MLVAFVLKKSNERISYLVAVHRFTFGVLVCQSFGMVGWSVKFSGTLDLPYVEILWPKFTKFSLYRPALNCI